MLLARTRSGAFGKKSKARRAEAWRQVKAQRGAQQQGARSRRDVEACSRAPGQGAVQPHAAWHSAWHGTKADKARRHSAHSMTPEQGRQLDVQAPRCSSKQ